MAPEDVLNFWFQELEPNAWWRKDPASDRGIAQRFGATLEAAGRGELFHWRDADRGRLAEIIVLDQFSRNIFRDTPGAFSRDPLALALSQEAVRRGIHHTLSADEQTFLCMPYMHSESRIVHVEAEALFRQLAGGRQLDYELKHKAIIDRFGRYPHRNAIMRRTNTPEEELFLAQPGAGF